MAGVYVWNHYLLRERLSTVVSEHFENVYIAYRVTPPVLPAIFTILPLHTQYKMESHPIGDAFTGFVALSIATHGTRYM